MFYVDIDGAISGLNLRVLLHVCNDYFALHIDDERLATLGYWEFMEQPEVLECRARLGEREFDCQRTLLDFRPEVLRSKLPLPGAVKALHHLADFGQIHYLTCRKPALLDDTRYWLRTCGFPNPEDVCSVLCVMNKWVQLAFLLKEQPGSLWLIDGRYGQLITEFDTLQRGEHPKLSREQCQDMATCLAEWVTLVAFGAREPVTHATLSVISLPSWQNGSSDVVLEQS